QLWRLTLTHHSRIFTHQSIPDIIKVILDDNGLASDAYVLKLAAQYPVEEHVCQYKESDLDFIARWMEREGLYYYFEHGEDREKLIITDSSSFQGKLHEAPIRFFASAGHNTNAGECLRTLTCRHRTLPASVAFKDHDYTKPKLDVSG